MGCSASRKLNSNAPAGCCSSHWQRRPVPHTNGYALGSDQEHGYLACSTRFPHPRAAAAVCGGSGSLRSWVWALLEAAAAGQLDAENDMAGYSTEVTVLEETSTTFSYLALRIGGWVMPHDCAAAEQLALSAAGAAEAAVRLLGLLVQQRSYLSGLPRMPALLRRAGPKILTCMMQLQSRMEAIHEQVRGCASHCLQQAVFWVATSIAKVVASLARLEVGHWTPCLFQTQAPVFILRVASPSRQ